MLILLSSYRIGSPVAMQDHLQCHGPTADPQNPNLGGEESGYQYIL